MGDLGLCVLFSSLIFVVFKLFPRFGVRTRYAIIINYAVAALVGCFFYQGNDSISDLPQKPWLPGTLALGILFILVFHIMGRTSQTLGVAVASVATKMSLAIPVMAGVFLYGELLGPLKVLGILLALAAVFLASWKEGARGFSLHTLILPGLLFIGSGIIDASIKYMQGTYISQEEFPLFSATVFASAATAGFCYAGIESLKVKHPLNLHTVLGGIALGVPNFFSIYFLLRALDQSGLNSASVFTIANVAIVMLSTLLGILLFRETLRLINWAGIFLAVLSILLVAMN